MIVFIIYSFYSLPLMVAWIISLTKSLTLHYNGHVENCDSDAQTTMTHKYKIFNPNKSYNMVWIQRAFYSLFLVMLPFHFYAAPLYYIYVYVYYPNTFVWLNLILFRSYCKIALIYYVCCVQCVCCLRGKTFTTHPPPSYCWLLIKRA